MGYAVIRRLLGSALMVMMAAGAFAQDAIAQNGERREAVLEKDLPKPVAAAMHSHRRAIFVRATKVTRGGQVEYQLTLKGSRKTAMVVKPDGTVISFK
jgi:hypothetical protein